MTIHIPYLEDCEWNVSLRIEGEGEIAELELVDQRWYYQKDDWYQQKEAEPISQSGQWQFSGILKYDEGQGKYVRAPYKVELPPGSYTVTSKCHLSKISEATDTYTKRYDGETYWDDLEVASIRVY